MYRQAILLFLISVTNGLQLQGPCDTNITYDKAINVKEVAGNWYEIERIPNSYQEGDCPSWTITSTTQNNTINIDLSIKEVVNGTVAWRDGNITTAGLGEFLATFSDGLSISFVIVNINYKENAVLYSCTNNGENSEVLAWKLSRNLVLSNATKTVFQEYTGLSKGNNWTLLSHTESACKVNNAINIHISPVILLIAGLLITKELF